MKVADLTPGDLFDVPFRGGTAVFVAQVDPHPIWPYLRLVIWRMGDGSWSHDALDARQDVGEPRLPASPQERAERVRAALLHPSASDRSGEA